MMKRRTKRCRVCFKHYFLFEKEWFSSEYCSDSCRVIDLHKHSYYNIHYVPDPKYHRTGDGWRYVKKWIRNHVKIKGINSK